MSDLDGSMALSEVTLGNDRKKCNNVPINSLLHVQLSEVNTVNMLKSLFYMIWLIIL